MDAPRSEAPRTIGDEAVECVVALTLEEAPRGATHRSTRAMARRAGMCQTAVSRIWRAFSLRPHRAETFKPSPDPTFVEKMRDIVGLYPAPPDRALVLCVDEKRACQASRASPLVAHATGACRLRPEDVQKQAPCIERRATAFGHQGHAPKSDPVKARVGSRRGGHAERSPEWPGLRFPRPCAEEDAGPSE